MAAGGRPGQHGNVGTVLRHVADCISNADQLEALGLELGFEIPQIDRFRQTNLISGEVTTRGTKQMLRAWAEGVETSRQVEALRSSLVRAGLVQIAKMCMNDAPVRSFGKYTQWPIYSKKAG